MNLPKAAVQLWILCLLALGVALSACSTVSLPRLPKWQPPADSHVYTAAEIDATVHRYFPGAQVITSDSSFTAVNHAWVEAVAVWSGAWLRATGWRYTPESFDCEDFADAFALAIKSAAGLAGIKASPLVAKISVLQQHSFAGVPGEDTSRHALIGCLTDRGLFVLEPQSGGAARLVPLADYPNQIYRVNLGD